MDNREKSLSTTSNKNSNEKIYKLLFENIEKRPMKVVAYNFDVHDLSN